MRWRGNYSVDLVLPFGLRFIFDSVASAVEWFALTIIAFLPVSLLGRFSDSRPAIIASVPIEREHRLCCFCPSWSSASPRGMRGVRHVFSLSRHRAQLSNPNCSLTRRQICTNRYPAPYVVHQTYMPSSGIAVLDCMVILTTLVKWSAPVERSYVV